jgi:protein TonB
MNLFKNNWESPNSDARLSTVFADRNQKFGAYVLRRDYDQTIMRAFVITMLAVVTLSVIPIIKNYFFSEPTNQLIGEKDIVIEMVIPETPVQPEKQKQPEANNQKPEASTIRDIIPIVVNHNSTDTIRTQNELSNLNTGLTTTNVDTTNKGPANNGESGNNNNTNNNLVFHGWVEVMPAFPGGESEMMKYLGNNLKYPERAKDAEAQGTVLISFVVDKEGKISNPTIKRGIGFGCEEEAIRVIQKMPIWSPGKMNGQTVNVEYVLPIRFTLR